MQKKLEEIINTIKAKFTPINQSKNPEEWRKLRTIGIGGSDAGAILGLNKYASPLTVYFQKKEVKGFEGNLATEWGQILEDPIRKKIEKEFAVKVYKVEGMFTSELYPFANANIDGIIDTGKNFLTMGNNVVSGIGGCEIKTSSRGEGFGDDEVPDSYYCQVQHYMAVTGFNWFLLTVFFLHNKTAKHYIIGRNDDFISSLMEREREFWFNNVLPEIIPAPMGIDSEDEYIKNLPFANQIELNDTVNSLIREERKLSQEIKELEKQQHILKNQILIEMSKNSDEESDNITATSENFIVTYNTQTKKSVDTDKLKAANLYETYSKTSSFKVLRIKEKK